MGLSREGGVGEGVRFFMLSIKDTFMNFNLYTVDVPSIEDGHPISAMILK